MASKHARKHEARPLRVKKIKNSRLDSNDFGFISNVNGYKRNAYYNLTCMLQTYCYFEHTQKTKKTVT